MSKYTATIAEAITYLGPRQHYARRVIEGTQRWSGADLKGKAKTYGAGYAHQRRCARQALWKANGCIVETAPHGELLTAVLVTTDDFGNGIYQTPRGLYVGSKRGNRVYPVGEKNDQ